jgi:subtilisin-like proprotein convertase family protein
VSTSRPVNNPNAPKAKNVKNDSLKETGVKGSLKVLAAFSTFSVASMAQATILPPNDLHLQDRVSMLANMTQDEFNDIINEVVDAYKPIVDANGAVLKSNNLWTNTTVNASAEQQGKNWIINMYGGLARRAEVTPDGFAMVVCHELGHHLGGFPFYGDDDWAASEGQSDYFATQSCARKIWGKKNSENARYADQITDFEKNKCNSVWSNPADRNLCYRTTAAGQSLANLLSALNNLGTPKTNTPDRRIARTTQVSHPQGQCRLDTYFSGALCKASFNENVIPARNPNGGQTELAAERMASQTSCMTSTGWREGNRPRCWFAPKMQFEAITFGYTEMDDSLGNNNRAVEPGEKVTFNFALSNVTQDVTRNVHGTLVSNSQGVKVTQASAQWPDIASGESKLAQSPFQIEVDRSLKCGSDFELELQADSERGGTSITKTFLVGKRQSEELGQNETAIAIPDNNKTGIISTLATTVAGNATEAKVDVAISHPFPTDLVVTLVSPEGKETKVYPVEGNLVKLKNPFTRKSKQLEGEEKGIFQSFNVKMPASEIQGEWKLKVVDKAARDEGTLKKWGLTLSRAVCEGTSTLTVKN